MNLKKKIREFCSLTRTGNGGFTLVELIVVIAILAILAGVAVPVYSGYIAKAEKAGDMQLLGAVNQAYVTAMVEHGIATDDVLAAVITLDANNCVKELQSVRVKDNDANTFAARNTSVKNTLYSGNKVAAMNESFLGYFAGNETTAFKTLTKLAFNPNTGLFCAPEDLAEEEEVTMYFGDTPITVDGKKAAQLADSTFADAIGSEILLGKVGSVADIASSLLAGKGYSVIDQLIYGNDPENPSTAAYMSQLAAALGVSPRELSSMVKLNEMTDKQKADFFANSLVLTAAKQTEALTDTSFIGADNFASTLRTQLDDPATSVEAMTKAAMAYGMYTAFANSSYCTDADIKNSSLDTSGGFAGMTGMLSALESNDEFTKYMASEQGKSDLAAYKSAMGIINDSTGQSTSAAIDVMKNGFGDAELSALLAQIMGK